MEKNNNFELHELYYLVSVYPLHGDVLTYDMEAVWQIVNDHYRKAIGIGLDITKESNRETLYKWLQSKARYDLLDSLISHMYNRLLVKENELDNVDYFFVNNIKVLWHIMEEYQNEMLAKMASFDHLQLSPISKKETIGIVKDILSEIDPNDEWRSIYEEALANNHIVYLNELEEAETTALLASLGVGSVKEISNSCLTTNSGEIHVYMNYTNTIQDVPNTIHEIIHYIIKRIDRENLELPTLREYPSIFFEMYALNYLKKLGYADEEISAINNARMADTFRVCDDVKELMYYLMLIIEKGHINEKLDKRKYREELKKITKHLTKKDIEDIKKEDPIFFNVVAKCHERCDKATYDLMLNPCILFTYYPYAIGSYLSEISMQKLAKNPNMLSMIKYITEKLTIIDAYDVFCVLDCNRKELVPTNYQKDDCKPKRRIRNKK